MVVDEVFSTLHIANSMSFEMYKDLETTRAFVSIDILLVCHQCQHLFSRPDTTEANNSSTAQCRGCSADLTAVDASSRGKFTI